MNPELWLPNVVDVWLQDLKKDNRTLDLMNLTWYKKNNKISARKCYKLFGNKHFYTFYADKYFSVNNTTRSWYLILKQQISTSVEVTWGAPNNLNKIHSDRNFPLLIHPVAGFKNHSTDYHWNNEDVVLHGAV